MILTKEELQRKPEYYSYNKSIKILTRQVNKTLKLMYRYGYAKKSLDPYIICGGLFGSTYYKYFDPGAINRIIELIKKSGHSCQLNFINQIEIYRSSNENC